MSKVRPTPGHSITERISGRFHTRRVGSAPSFFHRFGLQDPFTVSAPADRSDRRASSDASPFVWLSAAAYHAEVSAARYRMLQRTEERQRSRVGERLERVGPVAAQVAPIRWIEPMMASGLTTLQDKGELDSQAETAVAAVGPRRRGAVAPKARSRGPVRRQEPIAAPAPALARPVRQPRPSVAPTPRAAERLAEQGRPAARAVRRVEPLQRTARSLSRAMRDLRGADRRAVADALESVLAAGPELVDDAPRAERALAAIRRTMGELRPASRATLRAGEAREVAPAGLRRVTERSPTLVAMERPAALVPSVREAASARELRSSDRPASAVRRATGRAVGRVSPTGPAVAHRAVAALRANGGGPSAATRERGPAPEREVREQRRSPLGAVREPGVRPTAGAALRALEAARRPLGGRAEVGLHPSLRRVAVAGPAEPTLLLGEAADLPANGAQVAQSPAPAARRASGERSRQAGRAGVERRSEPTSSVVPSARRSDEPAARLAVRERAGVTSAASGAPLSEAATTGLRVGRAAGGRRRRLRAPVAPSSRAVGTEPESSAPVVGRRIGAAAPPSLASDPGPSSGTGRRAALAGRGAALAGRGAVAGGSRPEASDAEEPIGGAPAETAERWTDAVEPRPAPGDRATARAAARSGSGRPDLVAAPVLPYVVLEQDPEVAAAPASDSAPGSRRRAAVRPAARTRSARRATGAASEPVAAAVVGSPAGATAAEPRRFVPRPGRALARLERPTGRRVAAPGSVVTGTSADESVPSASGFELDLLAGRVPFDARAVARRGARSVAETTLLAPEPKAEVPNAPVPRPRRAAPVQVPAARQPSVDVPGRRVAPVDGAVRRAGRAGRGADLAGGAAPVLGAAAPVAPARTRPARRAADRATVTPSIDGRGRSSLRAAPAAHVREAADTSEPRVATVGRSSDRVSSVTVERVVGRRVRSAAAEESARQDASVGSVARAALRGTATARTSDRAVPTLQVAPQVVTLVSPEAVSSEVEGAPARAPEVQGRSTRPGRVWRASEGRVAGGDRPTAGRSAPRSGGGAEVDSGDRGVVVQRRAARVARSGGAAAPTSGPAASAAGSGRSEPRRRAAAPVGWSAIPGAALRAVMRTELAAPVRPVALSAVPTAFLHSDPGPVDAAGVVAPTAGSRSRRPSGKLRSAAPTTGLAAALAGVRGLRAVGPSSGETTASVGLWPTERAALRDRVVGRLDQQGALAATTSPMGALRVEAPELRWLDPRSDAAPAAAADGTGSVRRVSSTPTSRRARAGSVRAADVVAGGRGRRPAPFAPAVAALAAGLRATAVRRTEEQVGGEPVRSGSMARARARSAPETVVSRSLVPRRAGTAPEGSVLRSLDLPEPKAPAGGRASRSGGSRGAAASAVHAALRSVRANLVGDTVRRVAQGGAVVGEGKVAPTLEARVVRDAEGRVIRATGRRSDGRTLALAPADLGLSGTAWLEGRAGLPLEGVTSPAARLAGRASSPASVAAGRTARRSEPLPGLVRRGGDAPVAFGPLSLASAPGSDLAFGGPGSAEAGRNERRSVGERPVAERRLSRTLLGVAEAVPAPARRRAGERRPRGGAPAVRPGAIDAPEAQLVSGAPEAGSPAGSSSALASSPTGRGSSSPAWARRVAEPGFGPGDAAQLAAPRVRVSGGLMTALARAGDPEEVVRLILERSSGLAAAANELPKDARTLVERIARTASAQEVAAQRVASLPQHKTATRRSLTPTSQSHRTASGHSGAGATVVQGVGASGMMKLAGKLMKLIHLAESERRLADAQRQVRMAEVRPDGGTGVSGGERGLDKSTMHKNALFDDVFNHMMQEIDNQRWRREDPDGPSI